MPVKYINEFQGLQEKLRKAEEEYNYQLELTERLDAIAGDFTENTILEIVLWKVNRYPKMPKELLEAINDLRKEYTEEKARDILRRLLEKECKGFDLPMASTVLRFACPDHLQIIDQRVYRMITPEVERLKVPYNIEEKIALYFTYLNRLKEVCREYGIEFIKADRILYQLDKIENKDIPIRY